MSNIKKFICDNMNEMSKEERENVYNILSLKVKQEYINMNPDGVRIDLDNVDKFVLNEIYEYMKEQIEKYKNANKI